MPSWNSCKQMLALASSVSLTHALVLQPHGTAFSVSAIAAPSDQQFDPAAELHRLSAKYPTTGHLDSRQTDTAKQQGSVIVKPQSGGLSFLVPTVVGNQTFNMLYDTGSADLWVYSNESSPYQSLEHPVYIPTASAELLPNYTWSIHYAGNSGDLSVKGVVFTDTVKAGPVTATKQAVQAATVIPFEFGSDGIMGLASSAINQVQPVKQKTFFETLQPTLQRKVFAANLRIDGNATWDFGYIDETKFTGDITYTPVVADQKHWTIDVKEYAVGAGPLSKDVVGNVIVDSGTSLVYLPDAVVNDYYSQIEGFEKTQGGSFTFPCNSTIPDFNFKVGDRMLSIPGRDVSYATYDPNANTCVGGITTSLNNKYSILGNLFMRNYYVIHSQEQDTPMVGFASH